MKKLALASLVLLRLNGQCQITLEQTYSTVNWETVYLTDIGNADYKYVYYECFEDRFSLFNLDHSPFILNIPVAESSFDCTKNTVGYITTALFDCDSTTLEYAILPRVPEETFYVYREDGTLIFSKDTSWGYWCYGCLQASTELRTIVNTPAGAKLNLINGFTKQVSIYSLCGDLPHNIDESLGEEYHARAYPNPSSSSILIEWMEAVPEAAELTILNGLSQQVRVLQIGHNRTTEVQVGELSAGTYHFVLQANSTMLQTGRFVVIR